ncbi:MAG: hypothetical protein OEW15_11505 [Nitrospirota bacterium]|nr:hypothetical protein [Nitrospirota bacterium]
MKITVTTVYEDVPASQLSWWVERIFSHNAVVREQPPGKVMQLKTDFTAGREVKMSTRDPKGTGRATTTMRLEK